jgi:hypothetical protein
MTAAFGTRPKRRLNRVMDALDFDYPDYEKLDKGAEGVKRKRVFSILSRQAARMVKEDEKNLKKRKSTHEPKATVSKKRKAETLEPKITEETPSTPPTTEIAEILEVMTEFLPIKLLSPLGPELMKFFRRRVSLWPQRRRLMVRKNEELLMSCKPLNGHRRWPRHPK